MSNVEDVGADASGPVSPFRIFRASDALTLDEHTMPTENVTAVDAAGIAESAAAGAGEGALAKVLFADPVTGLSLGYVWFKPGFVLPRHSHDADCVYYVISGEAHLGTEVLRAGDGFFVPSGRNYQYTAGSAGVEVLEFRTATRFHLRLSGNSAAAWRRVAEAAVANRDLWRTMEPPPAAARMNGSSNVSTID